MMVLAAACLFTANAFRMFQPQPNAYEQGEPIKGEEAVPSHPASA